MNDKLFTLSDWYGANERRNANPRDVLQSLLDSIDRTDPDWIIVHKYSL